MRNLYAIFLKKEIHIFGVNKENYNRSRFAIKLNEILYFPIMGIEIPRA